MEKVYKIISENDKYNIEYYINGVLDDRQFHSLNGINGEIKEGYININPNKTDLNKMQFLELEKTDWYFIRKIETGIDIPNEIQDERKLIRLKYDKLKEKL